MGYWVVKTSKVFNNNTTDNYDNDNGTSKLYDVARCGWQPDYLFSLSLSLTVSQIRFFLRKKIFTNVFPSHCPNFSHTCSLFLALSFIHNRSRIRSQTKHTLTHTSGYRKGLPSAMQLQISALLLPHFSACWSTPRTVNLTKSKDNFAIYKLVIEVMSGPPRVRPMNIAHLECRPVLAPAGNKTRPTEPRKAVSKPTKKSEKTPQDLKHKKSTPSSQPIAVPNFPQRETAPSLLRRQDSMTASCSSDASSSTTDTSSLSGRVGVRKKQYGLKREKVESVVGGADSLMADSIGSLESTKRCAWVTPTTGMYSFMFF